MISWQALTDLGDAAFILTVATGIAAWLIATNAARTAAYWIVSFCAAMTVVVGTKIAFWGWGIGIRSLDFTGISGHCMLAAAVFPVLAHLLLFRASPRARFWGVTLGFFLALAIGISRVILHAHSVFEVVTGLALGSLVALAFMRQPLRRTRLAAPTLAVAVFVAALGIIAYGHHAHAEHWIVAAALKASGRARPYTRIGWHAHHAKNVEAARNRFAQAAAIRTARAPLS